MVNSVALAFILQIDELFCHERRGRMSIKAQKVMSKADEYEGVAWQSLAEL